MLKDDSSNDADQVRDLWIILVAAQKNYVLYAPLGDRPIAGADADVMNVWQARYDDYLIVQLKGHAVPPCVVLVIDDNLYGLTVAVSYI